MWVRGVLLEWWQNSLLKHNEMKQFDRAGFRFLAIPNLIRPHSMKHQDQQQQQTIEICLVCPAALS